MAGKTIDMSRIKQLLQLKKLGLSNRQIAKELKIEELETSDARGIPAGAVNQLATGEYLKAGATIIISGPTGTGKSFLACALGERACRLGYKVRYL